MTIKSIIDQTYPNIEYIVIDGNSNDGTIDIIKKYQNKSHIGLATRQNGIYDADEQRFDSHQVMVNFMNAGDMFYDKTF